MAWTETIRRHYRREALRYASNLTNVEWAADLTLLPAAGKPKNHATHATREARPAGSSRNQPEAPN
ncbi:MULTISPECIES: hypothetical protein [Mesorhizobium]|uniref:hypothetical protein n=1 Tax=Mesorhizobium norvegicum TaxID=1085774 RepID=UPI0010A9710E